MTPGELATALETPPSRAASLPVVVGFDAFVDEVVQVVGTRTAPDAYDPLRTLTEFGAWASAAAGRSGLREIVARERAAGGCAVNTGDGLAALGFPVEACAGVGTPPDPAFSAFASVCRSLRSPGMDPGRSLVMEFQDGKLMFSAVSHFAGFTPDHLAREMSDGRYAAACASAAGIVLTSWSVYPHMTACWQFLQREVYGRLTHRPRFFLDLADPAGRTSADLASMTDALAGFEAIGPTTLSLNGNEATRLAAALGVSGTTSDLERLASDLRQRAGITELGIHTITAATTATDAGTVTVTGPHCAHPRRSVGAGDRFNAGWLAGTLLGLSPAAGLRLGVAASGCFVRTARSATFPELLDFLRRWEDGALDTPAFS